MIVRLSVLRKTIVNPEYEVIMFSLMYVLALNYRLQIEHVNSDCAQFDVMIIHSLLLSILCAFFQLHRFSLVQIVRLLC